MVATLRMRRGARKNRRITTSSTTAPSNTAAAMPVRNATSQLAPLLTTSSTASDAGAAPRSPCAKFRIRLARYTSAMPSEMSAVSPPSSAPCTTIPAGGPHRICTTSRNSALPTTTASARSMPVVAIRANVTVGSIARVGEPRPSPRVVPRLSVGVCQLGELVAVRGHHQRGDGGVERVVARNRTCAQLADRGRGTARRGARRAAGRRIFTTAPVHARG